jgi:hypothetical protein
VTSTWRFVKEKIEMPEALLMIDLLCNEIEMNNGVRSKYVMQQLISGFADDCNDVAVALTSI